MDQRGKQKKKESRWGRGLKKNPGRGQRFFSSAKSPDILFKRSWGSVPGVKQTRRKVTHSPPCSAEVKNEWSNTSAPPIRVDRENFNFYTV
jgi:hypothetical protein